MSETPSCPKCNYEYTYEDRDKYVCPECSHEWSQSDEDSEPVYKDANGTILQDGDTVTLTKDLKIKGSASKIKTGTKVKNIRLVDGDHNIDCKVDGVGPMMLKSEFVKKI